MKIKGCGGCPFNVSGDCIVADNRAVNIIGAPNWCPLPITVKPSKKLKLKSLEREIERLEAQARL